MSLIEKAVGAICDICESNFIFDHITRIGMDDEYYVMAMALEAQKKAAKPVLSEIEGKEPRRWLRGFTRRGTS